MWMIPKTVLYADDTYLSLSHTQSIFFPMYG